ncbi:MAG: AEC family transporter [Ramlibacter sp.]
MEFARLLFPDFATIVAGFLLCRYTPLDRSVWEPVERLVYHVLFPLLLFQSIVRSPIDVGAASAFIGAGLLLGISGIVLAYLLPHLPVLGRGMNREDHAAAAQVAFRFNSFVALALAERLAGARGLQLIAVLIGVCVPLFNIAAVWPMVRHQQTGFLAALLRNPLIVATIAGLAANMAGLSIPALIEPTVARISGSSIALGLMAAGAGMQFGTLARSKLLTAGLLGIRHVAMPLVAWALVRLFHLDATQALVLMAFAGLPTASSAYVLASRMGYNGAYVAGLVTLSTILGPLSLTLALGVLR